MTTKNWFLVPFIFTLLIILLFCSACSEAMEVEVPEEMLEEENDCQKMGEDVLEPHAEGNYWERIQQAYIWMWNYL